MLKVRVTWILAAVAAALGVAAHTVTCEWSVHGPEEVDALLVCLHRAPCSESDSVTLDYLQGQRGQLYADVEKARATRTHDRERYDDENLIILNDWKVANAELQLSEGDERIAELELRVDRFVGLYARRGTRRDAALVVGIIAPVILFAMSIVLLVIGNRRPQRSIH